MTRGRQHRPPCPVCGRWRRRDHNCPGPPKPDPDEELRRRPIKAAWWKKGSRG